MLRGVSFYRGTHQKDQWPCRDFSRDSFQLEHEICLSMQCINKGHISGKSPKSSYSQWSAWFLSHLSFKLVLRRFSAEKLVKLPEIVNQSWLLSLTAVVLFNMAWELHRAAPIRFSVRGKTAFILTPQHLFGQRCNGSRKGVEEMEPWLAAAFPACSAMTNDWLRTISKAIRIKYQPFQGSAKF